MFKFLWELFLDIITGEDHNPVPKNLFRTLEVNGKVLRFRVLNYDKTVAFPDEKDHQRWIDYHQGRTDDYTENRLRECAKLNDEELAFRYGLMRWDDSFYGYTQPFAWIAKGIHNTLTGEIEPHTPETNRRLQPGSRCNTQGAKGIVSSLPVEIESLCQCVC